MGGSRVSPALEAEAKSALFSSRRSQRQQIARAGFGLLALSVLAMLLWLASPSILLGRLETAARAVERGEARSETLLPLIADLERATQWRPPDAHMYRQLARAQRLAGDPRGAVAALEAAYRLQPGSLLLLEELAVMYEEVGATKQASQIWGALGVTPEMMVARGDQLYAHDAYAEALRWYDRAISIGAPIGQERLFSVALAAVIAGTSPRVMPSSLALPVHPVGRGVTQIDGASLQWKKSLPAFDLQPGDVVSGRLIGERLVGVMWWDGVAVALIDVVGQGRYTLTLRAQNSRPAPIRLQLEHNGAPVQRFDYARGDESWQEYSSVLELGQGMHVIGVRFIADINGDGLDRDAVIDWLRIEEQG